MKPIMFPEVNMVLGPPLGMTLEECGPLPIHTDGVECISVWRLDPLELAMLNRNGGLIRLVVVSGPTQPPVALDIYEPESKGT